MFPIIYHTAKRLPDDLLATIAGHTTLEKLLAWTTTIAAMVQQDEFSTDIVIATAGLWLVYDVT